jgi:hypothetical protein
MGSVEGRAVVVASALGSPTVGWQFAADVNFEHEERSDG